MLGDDLQPTRTVEWRHPRDAVHPHGVVDPEAYKLYQQARSEHLSAIIPGLDAEFDPVERIWYSDGDAAYCCHKHIYDVQYAGQPLSDSWRQEDEEPESTGRKKPATKNQMLNTDTNLLGVD